MKRGFLLALVVLLAGCMGAPRRMVLDANWADGWAYAIAGGVLFAKNAKPNPAPAPQPAPGKCSNCNGTGKLPGDGVIAPTCPVCNGTGKAKVSVLKPAAKPSGKPAARPASSAGSCSSGSCGAPRTQSYAPTFRLFRRR